MKRTTLERLTPLLEEIRAHPALHEMRPMVFHLDGRPFLHFHEEPEGIFADVLLVKGRVHLPVSTDSEQSELLEQIDHTLSSLDSRVRDQVRRIRREPRHRARWIFTGRRRASD